MSDEGNAQTITAIERAADVLGLFGESNDPDLGVTEIAQSLGLSKAVVHRILASFKAKNFVVLDEATRRYRLGPEVLRLGLAYLDRIDVRTLARSEMQALSSATDETATLSIRTGDTRVYIDQVTPARDVKMVVQLGSPVPLHAGSSSKAFLAWFDDRELDRYLSAPLESLTDLTITDATDLRKDLTAIRQRGYAASLGERLAGSASVAAPVLGHDGRPVAVISVCGPRERFEPEAAEAAQRLLQATARLSLQMGHRP